MLMVLASVGVQIFCTLQVVDLRRQQHNSTNQAFQISFSCTMRMSEVLVTRACMSGCGQIAVHRHVAGTGAEPRIEECFNCLALFIDSRVA